MSATADWTAEGNQVGAGLGSWVSTAEDVNGDGYGDVIVGAYTYDNGETDEGRAFLYYGTATGIAVTPAWTAESNQADAVLGQVSATGDVNGDGYDDVIVGAPGWDGSQHDAGRAWVYYGSASGLSTSPDWTAEGTQPDAYFGYAIGAAGDVNGDGYSDVLVGESGTHESRGRAYLCYGSESGLSTVLGWSVQGQTWAAAYGFAVGTAGDVNGDGYSDVAVGSPGYDGGMGWAQGAVYVYHGSAKGLQPSADWMVVGDQAGSYFGVAVKTAGDVSGDGYADLVVGTHRYSNGQYEEGRASFYFGSRTGLNSSAAWVIESNQTQAYYGCTLGSAGDVNADGYADLIVGAVFFDAGQADEGAAFVYYGNQGGLSLQPQQLRSDDSAPIAYLGKSDESDSFRLALLGRTPFGRGKVKLEWEVKPRGVLFDGAGLQRSAEWIDTGTAGDGGWIGFLRRRYGDTSGTAGMVCDRGPGAGANGKSLAEKASRDCSGRRDSIGHLGRQAAGTRATS